MKTAQLPTLIDSFDGPWGFLSNFHAVVIDYEGLLFPSVEHAYQAAKSTDMKVRDKFTYPGLNAGQAKKIGQNVALRPDWEQVKLTIMEELLRQKFAGSILHRKLVSTFRAQLVEGNWWHDTFYGVCDGSGRHWKCRKAYPNGHKPYGANHLGKLLMKIRDEALNKQQNTPIQQDRDAARKRIQIIGPDQGLLF